MQTQDNHHSLMPHRGPDPVPASPRGCLTGGDEQKIHPMCATEPSSVQRVVQRRGRARAGTENPVKYMKGRKPKT